MIHFNKPAVTGNELKYLQEVISNQKISGDGEFSLRCHQLLEQKLNAKKVLLTSSGTDALEMAALLADIQPGDEVIMPSYTFVSTANAFVLRGANIVFVDIRPDTLNIDERLIERAITPKTKAIVPVHYAGVACEMDTIMDIAERHQLWVIEDAAHGVLAYYKGRGLGTIGHFGCFSFHETKNYSCGEGGAILVNHERHALRAEIIREKGTNRSQFFRGEADKYTWLDIGSSFLPSELQAAFLYAQLESAELIEKDRMASWQYYYQRLSPLAAKGLLELPVIPADCQQNAHLFYIKTRDLKERTQLIAHLLAEEVMAVFHYVPLHSSVMGLKHGRFAGADRYTTIESERIVRLPLYYQLDSASLEHILKAIYLFYA
ncbi:MAG: dTDP-4-amino-4,6-dideoxygalactose transaminase [Methylococcaceae bacterium]|nr:dTDP-4-amino-4,6-dideoxygalactose transaminase [Methylococcaceae bacterium]